MLTLRFTLCSIVRKSDIIEPTVTEIITLTTNTNCDRIMLFWDRMLRHRWHDKNITAVNAWMVIRYQSIKTKHACQPQDSSAPPPLQGSFTGSLAKKSFHSSQPLSACMLLWVLTIFSCSSKSVLDQSICPTDRWTAKWPTIIWAKHSYTSFNQTHLTQTQSGNNHQWQKDPNLKPDSGQTRSTSVRFSKT